MAHTLLDSYCLNDALSVTGIMYYCHKDTRNVTLNFGSIPLSSSSETSNPKTQLTKNVAHTLT